MIRDTYQFSFCVSGAILSSTPSFSAHIISTYHPREHRRQAQNSPRSLILKTPDTVLLVLRCLGSFLSLGEAGTSEMAESTLLRSAFVSCTPAAMMTVCVSEGSTTGLKQVNSELWKMRRRDVPMQQ